ncbi:PHP domain-containing protein [Modestobacter sp. VKM Ac-2986]|uniref:PHP domain-containing protein n=1 Tax=Modestobacter sp. VKM Ac-2986 TaxID=3004140 RepID=UPI0022AB5375|nr:PHP domain-containing protein [Modestobacter sp. VKM Ac-2986]MCZ2830906.1 PHP domain-containing protein [Modestobacter sp. VKM Ac-2986]
MSHDHEHHHHGGHDHHHADAAGVEGTWVDPEADDPLSVSRRAFLATATVVAGAAAGLGGTVAGVGQGVAAATDRKGRTSNAWSGRPYFLAGDHHIHTQFSPDAQYEIETQVSKAQEYGLDWVVITDHGSVAHQKFSIDQVTPRIEATRKAHPDMLVYQGLEWNIPGAEHATVFMPPGRSTVDILKAFEGGYDGSVLTAQGRTTANNPAGAEPFAIDGLRYLEQQVRNRRTEIALMFANHPSRQGIDSPHEIRNWRETAPGVAVGMEGAPGHQAAGIPAPAGPGGGRGYYDRSAGANSFAAYPPESYRTFGGFDWMTATVGGLWDSLLAEGLPFWVTATSDSHQVYRDTFTPGTQDYATTGSRGAPIDTGAPITSYGDFWPGQYSSTLVASNARKYVDLMKSLQAGKVIAVHGRLIEGLDLRVRSPRQGDARGVTLGGTTWVRRGGDVDVSITVELAAGPNANGDVPKLAKVDLISGPVTGRVKDKDTFRAPETRVVETFEVRKGRKTATFNHTFRNVQDSFYLRLRGSDGKQLDSAGNPPMDKVGDANPWDDLWFYANPVFVDVV